MAIRLRSGKLVEIIGGTMKSINGKKPFILREIEENQSYFKRKRKTYVLRKDEFEYDNIEELFDGLNKTKKVEEITNGV